MGVYYNEIDPYAAQWLRNLIAAGHIAPGEVDERSIEDVKPDDLKKYTQCPFFAGIGVWSYALKRAGWPDDKPVRTGSCPCQPFSAAGKREGFTDERHLWPAFFHLIEQRKPPVVFGEQVASKDGLAWLDVVQADMEGAGYAFGAADICAAGVGAPHIRQRLYFVGELDYAAAKGLPLRSSETVSGRQACRVDQRSGNVGGLADSSEQSSERHARGVFGKKTEGDSQRHLDGGLSVGHKHGGADCGMGNAERERDDGKHKHCARTKSTAYDRRQEDAGAYEDRNTGAVGGMGNPRGSGRQQQPHEACAEQAQAFIEAYLDRGLL